MRLSRQGEHPRSSVCPRGVEEQGVKTQVMERGRHTGHHRQLPAGCEHSKGVWERKKRNEKNGPHTFGHGHGVQVPKISAPRNRWRLRRLFASLALCWPGPEIRSRSLDRGLASWELGRS